LSDDELSDFWIHGFYSLRIASVDQFMR
jgi:hypothetical protein